MYSQCMQDWDRERTDQTGMGTHVPMTMQERGVRLREVK
jgi:hypothetical protein